MADLALRHWIHATLAETGRAPTRNEIDERVGSSEAAARPRSTTSKHS